MKRSSTLILVALVVLSLPTTAAVGAGAAEGQPAIQVGDNRRIGNDQRVGRLSDIPGIAVNPADPNHMVAVSEDFVNGQCEHHVSFDAGATWETGQLRAPEGFPSPPCPVFDSGGYAHMDGSVAFGSGTNVYTVFSSIRGVEGDTALVARSTDGGRSFGVAVVALPGGKVDQPINSRPKLAVQPRPEGDRVVVESWLAIATNGAGPGKAYRTSVAVSDDGGVTWGPPVDASPLGQTTREIDAPALAPDGTIHLAWTNQDDSPRSIWTARSNTGGKTWTSRRAAPAGRDPRIAVDPSSGLVFLAYQVSFGPDVLVRRSADGGLTWSDPVEVTDEDKAEKRLPQIDVAGNGRVDVLWHDRRHNQPGAVMEDYYYAYSTDGGLTFSRNHRVTDRSINTDIGTNRRITGGFYAPALASFADNSLIAAWGDSREGNFDTDNTDVYLARIDLGGTQSEARQSVTAADLPATSVALSRLAYPAGRETRGTALATKVVVVNEADLTSSLAGSVLARAHFGPVLVTGAAGLTDEVKEEVKRLAPGEALLLGDESVVGAGVVDDLVAAGVARDRIRRIAGASGADTARLVAESMDLRARQEKPPLGAVSAFAGAVIVNPTNPEAAAASALAASLRLPVLLVERDAVPQPTKEALASLSIPTTLVVGGVDSVSEAVVAALPSPKRLRDAGAIAMESKERGLATNVVYLADSDHPVRTAVLGAAVARPGGFMVSNPGGDEAGARATLRALGLDAGIDRFVSVSTPAPAPRAVAATTTASRAPALPATGGSSNAAWAAALLALALAGRRFRRAATEGSSPIV